MLLGLAYGAFAVVRSVPVMTVVSAPRYRAFSGRMKLDWPSQGEAAVGVQGVGPLRASHAMPKASLGWRLAHP